MSKLNIQVLILVILAALAQIGPEWASRCSLISGRCSHLSLLWARICAIRPFREQMLGDSANIEIERVPGTAECGRFKNVHDGLFTLNAEMQDESSPT